MAGKPDFIQHYIDQLISDDCVVELTELAYEYEKKSKEINNPQRHEGDRRYREEKGRENPRSVQIEQKFLDIEFAKKANQVTERHAKLQGVEVIPFEAVEEIKPTIKPNLDHEMQKFKNDMAQAKDRTLSHSTDLNAQKDSDDPTMSKELREKYLELKNEILKRKGFEPDGGR